MEQCWAHDPNSRPEFLEIFNVLKSILKESNFGEESVSSDDSVETSAVETITAPMISLKLDTSKEDKDNFEDFKVMPTPRPAYRADCKESLLTIQYIKDSESRYKAELQVPSNTF